MLQIFRNPWFIFGLIVFGALSTRVVFEGVKAWDKGVIAIQNGDDDEAIAASPAAAERGELLQLKLDPRFGVGAVMGC